MSLKYLRLDFADKGNFTMSRDDYTLKYKGESNNRFDNPASIRRDRLVPQLGDQLFDIDPRARVYSIDCDRREKTLLHWTVTVRASTATEEVVNPLNLPARIVPSSEQETELTRKNAKGDWIMNAVGTIIPLERRVSNWVFTVEKNLPYLPEFMMEMNNKINSGTIFLSNLALPKRTLMVFGMRGEPLEAKVFGTTVKYQKVSFKLMYSRKGFKVKYPNADIMEIDTVQLAEYEEDLRTRRKKVKRDEQGRPKYKLTKDCRIPILDEDLQPRTEPWPLDKDGKALPLNYTEQDLVEYEEDVYDEVSFTLLPLR